MNVAFFTRYEEVCTIIHSSETAIKLLIELKEMTSTNWDLLMTFNCTEESLKVYDDWCKGVDTLLGDIEFEVTSSTSSMSESERMTALKLIKHYKAIENTCPKLDDILGKTKSNN